MIGLHPQAALRIDTDAIRAGEGVALDVAHQVRAAGRQLGIAGQQEDFPGEGRRQRRIVLFLELDDVTMKVARARVGRVGDLTAAIVGQRAIDCAVVRRDGQPFRTIHHGAACDARCGLGVDQHVGLAVEINGDRRGRRGALADIARIDSARHQAVLLVDQRAPFPCAIGVEARDIERAVIQQVGIGSAVRRVERAIGHELVDATRRAVITHVEGNAVVAVGHVRNIFMVEPAHGGALRRLGKFLIGVDFDHPAVILLRLRRIEIIVRAFLAGQIGAPGGAA